MWPYVVKANAYANANANAQCQSCTANVYVYRFFVLLYGCCLQHHPWLLLLVVDDFICQLQLKSLLNRPQDAAAAEALALALAPQASSSAHSIPTATATGCVVVAFAIAARVSLAKVVNRSCPLPSLRQANPKQSRLRRQTAFMRASLSLQPQGQEASLGLLVLW